MIDYPLRCDFCNELKTLSESKAYSICITETLSNSDEEFPHKEGKSRMLQICKDCLKKNDIGKILAIQNRSFE